MSIFDAFRKPSPTAAWTEDPSVRLIADLDLHELSGVPFGGSTEELSFLGPSESRFFDYPSKGLTLEVSDSGLEGFVIALRPNVHLGAMEPRHVRPFGGHLRIRGREWPPADLRAERDFVEAWGQPYWRDRDEDEILLFFEFSAAEVQVELSLEGLPQVLVVTPQPLLADPAQREAYRVDVPWPPARFADSPTQDSRES